MKKINSEIKTIKRDLVLNFQIEDIYQAPDKALLINQWNIIIKQLNGILTQDKPSSDISYQELYMETNALLLHEIPSEAITSLNDILIAFSKEIAAKCNELIYQDNNFLQNFNDLWKKVIDRFNLIRKILNKFERKIYDNFQKNTIYLIFIDYLKENINEHMENFFDCLSKKINNEIIALRNQVITQRLNNNDTMINSHLSIIKLGVELLYSAGLYKDNFNPFYINSSSEFYKETSSQIIDSSSLDDYISFVSLVFDLENKIIINHLNDLTSKSMTNQLNHILIQDKTNEIFDRCYSPKSSSNDSILIDQFDLLKRIYQLFKGIKIDEEIKKRFSDYISQCSNKIYSKCSKEFIDLFNHLFLLKNNIDTMIKVSFCNDEKFKTLGKDCLAKAINAKPNFIADSFSRYIDHVITSDITNDQAERSIDDFMTIFKFLDAKDAFENFFILKLAKRCLNHLTTKSEWEVYLIEQFKKECGSVFVTKSEEMLNDIATSVSFSNEYIKQKKESNAFEYHVLSNYSWPMSKVLSGYVNETVAKKEKGFMEYYKVKNQGKSLTWHLPYCNCVLGFKGNDSHMEYSLKANGVHASILLKFTHQNKTIKTSELVKMTNIDRHDLLMYMKIITSIGILLFDKTKDAYEFNTSFNSKTPDIFLINTNHDETTLDDMEKVEERTLEDRKPVIDAHVIKLLKPKKQMKLEDLIIGVHKSVKFPCERQLIVSRINHLINLRHIIKDEKDDQLIKYN